MLELIGIGTAHTNYPDKNNQEFLGLNDYITGARRIIKKCISLKKLKHWNLNNLIYDEDFVSHVAHGMMMADWRFDPNKGMTRENFRFNYALYTIKSVLNQDKKSWKRRRRDGLKSLDLSVRDFNNLYSQIKDTKTPNPLDNLLAQIGAKCSDTEQISNCLTNGFLTPRESEAIHAYYVDDMTLEAAGTQLGVTRERVRQLVNSGIAKIKEFLNV